MSYCIVKTIKQSGDRPDLKILLLKVSAHTEVWEFKTEDEAEETARNLEYNSDSGHFYTVKKIGSDK